jgi:homoserine kinase
MRVTVPASSANLGPGFDVLGLALDLPFMLAVDDDDDDGLLECGPSHPARVAYERGGGRSAHLRWQSSIPPGRGLGFSGAAHVAGALAAVHERRGGDLEGARPEVLAIASELEGHPENAAASLYGGFVVVAGHDVLRVPMGVTVDVAVWWPDQRTSTARARRRLPPQVGFDDAVFNIGRTALLVAAFATGDLDRLRAATQDRLHTATRATEASLRVMDSWRSAGALGVWLSGSGPAVAAAAPAGAGGRLAEVELPAGRVVVLSIDEAGAQVF